MEVRFNVRIFREGDAFVAHAQELDISSCGDTEAEARKNIAEAVELFVETAKDMGTLTGVLEEAGYVFEGGRWKEPQTVATEQMQVKVA